MTLHYVSLFSGIEAFSVAASRIRDVDWRPVFFSEIEPFPCAVLAHHFPTVPNLGDICKIRIDHADNTATNGTTTVALPRMGIDILAGGSPCQDVSVAGKRAGMSKGSGTRSSLAFEYARLVRELRPRVILWENVPGVLSANGGRDFAAFLHSLDELGYSLAWRVLDCQYTRVDSAPRAVPQRRRRVWLVGCLGGDGRVPAQILFERPSLLGDTPPRREAGQGFAAPAGYGPARNGRVVGEAGGGISLAGGDVSPTLISSDYKGPGNTQDGKTIVAPVCLGKEAYNIGKAGQGSLNIGTDNAAQTVRADTHPSAVTVLDMTHADEAIREVEGGAAPTLQSRMGTGGNQVPLVSVGFKPGQSGREDTGSLGAQPEQSPTLPRDPGGLGVGVAVERVEPEVCKTLSAEGFDGMPDIQKGNGQPVVAQRVRLRHVVRRLTPGECETLQFFP